MLIYKFRPRPHLSQGVAQAEGEEEEEEEVLDRCEGAVEIVD